MWRIPFAHHPPYSAGPQHHNTRSMTMLRPLFDRAGVRVMFSGHEHNFQHSRVEGIDYFVTGGAGKFRGAIPDRFPEAGTLSWSAQCHFVLATIDGDRMIVRAIGEAAEGGTDPAEIIRRDPAGEPVVTEITIAL